MTAAMVTRKPVAPPVSTADPAADASSAPPYPTTPTAQSASSIYSSDLNNSPAFDLIDMDEARTRPRRDSDISSHGTWDSDGTEREDEEDELIEVPRPLNVRASQQNIKDEAAKQTDGELPAALRPGPANGAVGTKTLEGKKYEDEAQSNPWQLESKNPYLNKTPQQANGYPENTQKVWEQALNNPTTPTPQPPLQHTPYPVAPHASSPPIHSPPLPPQAPPPAPPVELPTVHTPSDELSRMSLISGTYETAETIPVPQPPPAPTPNGSQPFPSTNPWSDDSSKLPPAPPKEAIAPAALPAEDPWYTPPPGPPPAQNVGPLIDHAEPARPPPISTQVPAARPSESGLETPGTIDRRKRNEHYQIKHVNWYDSASGKAGLRRSPILTQNENGPCPLLALVNALVLSTPADVETALVETLRTREQVSLGLLLDAVFDELTSGRRGDSAYPLPDVAELYSFLLALHTGMNVNPRFITPATTPRGSLDGHPPELHGIHPVDRSQNKPGCFEETREMRLYSTFNIPLIHGWTAPKDTAAYMAFMRSAQTFEDAQNIQFAEAELEDKLRSEGLGFQEQQTLEDIQTIKSFLQTWPTQLTDHGLETISRSSSPGQMAILFRNDHFSTLYKEPRHGALMTLVTDAGYSSHEEIVWESLVDVNGAASELFSGDFRTVSHGQDARLNQSSSAGGEEGWQTVQNRTRRQQPTAVENPPPLPGPRPTSQRPADPSAPQTQLSASEQEDHDLALALQLQEEEEDHHRQAEERRRREQELSEQFLSNEEQPPAIPPRRQQNQTSRPSRQNVPVTTTQNRRNNNAPSARPAVNRPGANGDPDAPPTYEQSASDRPYRPAGSTAPTSQGNPLNTLDALRRQQSAYTQQSSTSVNSLPAHQRRASGNRLQRRDSQFGGPAPAYPGPSNNPAAAGRVPGAATVKDTEEKCTIM